MQVLPNTIDSARCWLVAIVSAVAVLSSSCAHWKMPKPPVEDIHPEIEARQKAVVQSFEARRTQAQLNAARAKAEQGDLAGCHTMLQGILDRDPKHPQARLLLAEVQLARGEASAAESTLQSVVRDIPDEAPAHFALGLLYESTGRPEQATTHFRRAASLQPDNELYAIGAPIGGPDHGTDSTSPTGKSIRVSDATATTGRQPVAAAAKSLRGRQLLAQAAGELQRGNHDAAAELMAAAIGSEPHNRQIASACSLQLLRHDQGELAIDLLNDARRRQPDDPALLQALGAAYLQANQPRAAQAVLSKAISLDNASGLSYFLLGQALSRQGHKAEASRALREAHLLDPRFPRQL